ncbi:hypothetical protein PILCRDRAFT_817601 [Piloderma croceum F 1598]|uniref:Uncharacterized protein n=1 Tax=Piloderma croceum (strain F 1598) TaxID=765440 RepID=A0A0C3BEQ8_PILCF|nr:hypothetical protein PILCRDRAFT_817601 [Piloderma croceum F 1598]
MGVDCGFDMVPFFAKGDSNDGWERFLDDVLKEFKDDPVVVPGELEIIFQVGEFPVLPRAGYAFRRFSSKVSGSCGASERYIIRVYRIGCRHFGDRIQWWHEMCDESGHYGWDEVYDARKEYIKSAHAGTEKEYNRSLNL